MAKPQMQPTEPDATPVTQPLTSADTLSVDTTTGTDTPPPTDPGPPDIVIEN